MSPDRPPIEPPPSRYLMPDPASAEPGDDLIAIGADLEPGTLLAAYRCGLFPMPVDPSRRRSDIAWYSPDPRGIIELDGFHVSRSLRRSVRRFSTARDRAFRDVMERCGDPARNGRWITPRFVDAYDRLHRAGWAHSTEVYDERGELVGGVYGVRIGAFFAGESMFHHATDASKVALVHLVDWLRNTGGMLFDVQWTTPHLESLGARPIPRPDYLERLATTLGSAAP